MAVLHGKVPRGTPLAPTRQRGHRCKHYESRQRDQPIKVCRRNCCAVLGRGVGHKSFREVRPAGKEQIGHHRSHETDPAEVYFLCLNRPIRVGIKSNKRHGEEGGRDKVEAELSAWNGAARDHTTRSVRILKVVHSKKECFDALYTAPLSACSDQHSLSVPLSQAAVI